MTDSLRLDEHERSRSLANLKLEQDAVTLYERLADIEHDPARAHAFRSIAVNERRHADVWAERLVAAGVAVPAPSRPAWRVRLVIGLARLFGTRAVSELVLALEGQEETRYASRPEPEVAAIAAEEREHAAIWRRLGAGMPGVPLTPASEGAMEPGVSSFVPLSVTRPHHRNEAWHRAAQSGTLRATVFGVNDGLVSNLALVMGVAGAAPDNRFIVLAGIAGLLAGAFSMGAGEYISMQSQRELFERQIELEREEMRVMPEVEEAELAAIYRAKGLEPEEAALVARRLMVDPKHALDTKIREELGLDPSELGSSWGAAIYSFVAFSVGAIIPLAPFLLTSGREAIIASTVLALVSLFAVGALVSLLTGRGLLYSGVRQAAIGGAAAAVTFVVGTIIGVQAG